MLKKLLLACLFTGMGYGTVYAQNAQTITIETKNTTVILNVGKKDRLYQSYLGKKLTDDKQLAAVHQAYIPAGTDDLFEPAIRVVHSDRNPTLDLRYKSFKKQTDGEVTHTSIVLQDPQYPIEVTLHYKAYYNEDVISTWAEVVHHEAKPITVAAFASAMLHFDAPEYWLTQFHGDWAKEQQIVESQLTSGIKVLDTKLGTRAQMYQSPFFMLSLNKPSDENTGEVLAGSLAWSGNFRFAFEIDNHNSLRVISGINPYASAYSLAPGKALVSPEFIFTYSANGKGQASRNMHQWARKYGIADGEKPRLTLLNNWESTKFTFDQPKLDQLISSAADMGVDMFLLDDGWFGNKYPRHDDKHGLGDWEVDTAILPGGVSHLVEEAEKKGIKFGIWVEPEMVNPKSVLYETHPDWVVKAPNREEVYYRNQLVLDLSNPKVQDYVFSIMDNLLTQNPKLAYFKWDCNSMINNAYSPYTQNQENFYIDYVKGLYKVMDRMTAKYPHLPMMLCSGGGARIDFGALKHFTEFWPSDDTDGLERVYIQWGYSYFYPANSVAAHVTSWGKESLKFRIDVAMMDKLGFDIDISKLSPNEVQFTKDAIKTYKRLSDVIWYGSLYRLVSPYTENRAVLMYTNADKNKAVLFNYMLSSRYRQEFNAVKLQGLDEKKKYQITEVNLFPDTKVSALNGKTFTGAYLMTEGLALPSAAALTSNIFEITEVK